MRLSKYDGGWVPGVWDSASTVMEGGHQACIAFLRDGMTYRWHLWGSVHSPIQPPLTVVSTQLSLEILKSDMVHSSLKPLPSVGEY